MKNRLHSSNDVACSRASRLKTRIQDIVYIPDIYAIQIQRDLNSTIIPTAYVVEFRTLKRRSPRGCSHCFGPLTVISLFSEFRTVFESGA